MPLEKDASKIKNVLRTVARWSEKNIPGVEGKLTSPKALRTSEKLIKDTAGVTGLSEKKVLISHVNSARQYRDLQKIQRAGGAREFGESAAEPIAQQGRKMLGNESVKRGLEKAEKKVKSVKKTLSYTDQEALRYNSPHDAINEMTPGGRHSLGEAVQEGLSNKDFVRGFIESTQGYKNFKV